MATEAPLESSVVSTLIKWLNKQAGVKAQKTHGSSLRMGTPDIIGCWQGRMFTIEVKRPGSNAVTALQNKELEGWRRAGAIVGVAHSLDELKEILRLEGIEWVDTGKNIRKSKLSSTSATLPGAKPKKGQTTLQPRKCQGEPGLI